MKLWQIVVVVTLGIAYGLIEPGRLVYALGHATLYVFLPALLFEAAWNLNSRAMRRQWMAIATLAGPGVLLTAAIVTGALSIVRIPFGPALLTGAILSATDPIAVVAVFRRLKIPVTLATIVECESLFNDAVAVALYRGVLIALTLGVTGMGVIARVTMDTLAGAAGGVVLGIALAYAAARLLRNRGNVTVQIVATAFCAYGAYFAADYLRLSGIFATIASGIALRYFERAWLTLRIADDVNRFWDLTALLANVLVFFMVGAALQIGRVAHEPIFAAACIVAIAVARILVAGLLLPGPYPREWMDVVRVAGMRGGLSLALALAIPPSLPYRQAIVDATFAVALATLAAGSLTIAPAVKRAAARTSFPAEAQNARQSGPADPRAKR
ncbi:MAG: cation:proton antiporter [Candidatus Eremiobacteraeota bacterium]|nr:cation:proton antiporter [Candidatus Eremiobacteraeota bacterium]